jgi:hypothetical protein
MLIDDVLRKLDEASQHSPSSNTKEKVSELLFIDDLAIAL